MKSLEDLQGLLDPLAAPCPFCGSSGSSLVIDPDYVQCVDCGAAGPECDVRGKGHVRPRASVEAWNRRPHPKAPRDPHRLANISRVSYSWLVRFECDGAAALWPEVQAMARELLERRRADGGK